VSEPNDMWQNLVDQTCGETSDDCPTIDYVRIKSGPLERYQ